MQGGNGCHGPGWYPDEGTVVRSQGQGTFASR